MDRGDLCFCLYRGGCDNEEPVGLVLKVDEGLHRCLIRDCRSVALGAIALVTSNSMKQNRAEGDAPTKE